MQRRLITNPVLLTLAIMIGAGFAGLAFITEAPNRLSAGAPSMIWQLPDQRFAATIILLCLAVLAGAVLPPRRLTHCSLGIVCVSLVLLPIFVAGQAAALLASGHPSASRTGLGGAFWIVEIAAGLGLLDSMQRAGVGFVARFLVIAGILGGIAGMAALGLARSSVHLARIRLQARGVLRRGDAPYSFSGVVSSTRTVF